MDAGESGGDGGDAFETPGVFGEGSEGQGNEGASGIPVGQGGVEEGDGVEKSGFVEGAWNEDDARRLGAHLAQEAGQVAFMGKDVGGCGGLPDEDASRI